MSAAPKRRRYNPHRDPRIAAEGAYRACVETVREALFHDLKLTRPTQRVGLYICGLMVASDSIKLRYCHPSGSTIAAALAMSERTVARAIAELKRAGYFFIKRGNKRDHQANRYWPLWQGKPAPAAIAEPAAPELVSEWAESPAEWRDWILGHYTSAEELPGWAAAADQRIVAFAARLQRQYNATKRPVANLGALWREVAEKN